MGRKKDILNLDITHHFLKDIAGDQAIAIVKICLRNNGKTLDEDIEKKTKMKITEVRTTLNQLYYRGVANYNKTKNKRSGWYTYTWEINKKRIIDLITEKQQEEVQKLEKTISFEKEHEFYSCAKKCANFAFEIAAEYEFKCPECNENMNLINNEDRIKDLNKKVKDIKFEIEELQNM